MKTITATKTRDGWMVDIIIREICKNEEDVLKIIKKENLIVLMKFDGSIYASDEDIPVKKPARERINKEISVEQEKAIERNGDDKIDDTNNQQTL